jgi:hypothetical protein
LFTLLNRVAYGLLKTLRSDCLFVPGFVLRPFPGPLSRSPDSHPRERGDPEKCERENRGGEPRGNMIHPSVPDLDSRLRGNDENRDCVWAPMRKTHQRSTRKFFQRTIVNGEAERPRFVVPFRILSHPDLPVFASESVCRAAPGYSNRGESSPEFGKCTPVSSGILLTGGGWHCQSKNREALRNAVFAILKRTHLRCGGRRVPGRAKARGSNQWIPRPKTTSDRRIRNAGF